MGYCLVVNLHWTFEKGSGVCASFAFRCPDAVSISRFCFSVQGFIDLFEALTTKAASISDAIIIFV